MLAASALLAVLGALVVWPVASVALLAAPRAVLVPHAAEIVLATLTLAGISTAVTVLLALVVASGATRADVPGRRLVGGLGLVPLAAPPYVAALAVALFVRDAGAPGRALGLGGLEGLPGLVLAQVLSFLPPAFTRLTGVLRAIDPELERAAESLGARRPAVFRHITLALARPGVGSTALVIFVLCLGDFATPFVLGGDYRVLSTEIYAAALQGGDATSAAALASVLLLPCLAAFALGGRWREVWASAVVAAAPPLLPRPTRPIIRWTLGVVSLLTAAAVAATYAALPLGALARRWGSDWSPSGRHFVLPPSAAAALGTSVELALVAGLAGTALALATAYVVERRAGPGRRLIERLSVLPAALPGGVVGLGYLVGFGAAFWTLAAAVVAWALPAGVHLAVGAVRRVGPELEEAAESLGARRRSIVRHITAPLVARPAGAIFVHFAVIALVTVSAVVFLAVPGREPASVMVLTAAARGDLGGACALATLVLALAVAAALLGRAPAGGRRQPRPRGR
ncbi:MAG: iron ABC transporter permease [Candidatus Rokubacteria bacterium]|nr:iron ABC transporter permease [Candidatus Rokubacteria bacterium]